VVGPGAVVVAEAKRGTKGKKNKKGKPKRKKATAADPAAKAKKKAAKRARRMEKAGKAAYRKGRFDDALIAFEAAYEADGKPRFLYNIARCHEKRGELAKAVGHYERYLEEAPDAEDREAVETQAAFLIKKLQRSMARLDVTSEPSGAGLRIQGEGQKRDVKAPWSGWLAPGRYELSTLLDGYEEETRKIALAVGEDKAVALKLEPVGKEAEAVVAGETTPAGPVVDAPQPARAPEEALAAAPPTEEPAGTASAEPPAESGGGLGRWPVVAFGAATAAAICGVAFGLLSSARHDEVADAKGNPSGSGRSRKELEDLAETANRYGWIANLSLAATALAGATGGVLLFAGSGSAGATVRWTW